MVVPVRKMRLLSYALILLSTGAKKSHAEVDALEKAKRLVLDLDASTGTVGYPPGAGGREKEPVTCNEIMAKSLVVANEEKAALLDEKETVVKAAGRNSDRLLRRVFKAPQELT